MYSVYLTWQVRYLPFEIEIFQENNNSNGKDPFYWINIKKNSQGKSSFPKAIHTQLGFENPDRNVPFQI